MNNTKESYELKSLSREQLIGKYGIAISAIITILATTVIGRSLLSILLLSITTTMPFINTILSGIFTLLLSIFSIGEAKLFLNIVTNAPVRSQDIFYGYIAHFRKSLGLSAIQLCIFYATVALPLIIIRDGLSNAPTNGIYLLLTALGLVGIITFIMLSLLFSQARFLLVDLPNLKVLDLFRYSNHIMKNQKIKLFYLWVSFVPLILVSILSFGIALLWIVPYMQATLANFYLDNMRSNS